MAIKISKNVLYPVLSLCGFAVISLLAYFQPWKDLGMVGKTIKPEAAVVRAIDYINENMLSPEIRAEYADVKEENGMYSFKLVIQGQNYASYVTKDGALLFAEGVPQAIILDKKLEEEKAAAEIDKSDRPEVKLFVMSYCPYGLQAQKMYLPVYELLKDKADMGIYFVNYAMHGKAEIDENLRQYCIQKEQSEKVAAYLKCFAADTKYAECSTEDCTADYGKCLAEAGIDQSKLSSCVAATDKEFNITADYNDKSTWVSGVYPKFAVNDDLNSQYEVQGSPTIIINGKDASGAISSRSPEKFKQAVCAAFNEQPEECSTVLSEEQPSSGFGAAVSASDSAAGSCN